MTRIVALEELRAISLPATSTKEGRALRDPKPVNAIVAVIVPAIKALTTAESASRGSYEILLFEEAVIYVHESAPVFLRIQYDFKLGFAQPRLPNMSIASLNVLIAFVPTTL